MIAGAWKLHADECVLCVRSQLRLEPWGCTQISWVEVVQRPGWSLSRDTEAEPLRQRWQGSRGRQVSEMASQGDGTTENSLSDPKEKEKISQCGSLEII